MKTASRFAPRIAIYGIGFLGKMVAKLTRENGWQIIAAYNRAGEKVGQDLGDLAEFGGPIGVVVQDYEKADYSDLDVDLAIIAGPDALDDCFPIYEKFLNAGANVLSFGTHAYEPSWFFPDIAEKIDTLAKKNGVTFTGSGLWDMTRIWSGLLLGGTSVSIDSIEYFALTDIVPQGIQTYPLMGVGLSVDEFDEKIGRKIGRAQETVQLPMGLVFKHYGFDISNITLRQEPIVLDVPVTCPGFEEGIPAGTCVGTRMLVEFETKQGATGKNVYEYRIFKPGEEECATWSFKGTPNMRMTLYREDSGVASASSLLNRVPQVLEARPGIVTILEMGPEKPGALMAL